MRGQSERRPDSIFCGVVRYAQSHLVRKSAENPAGRWIMSSSSIGPASSSSTLTWGSSLSRAAMTPPALPDPMMT